MGLTLRLRVVTPTLRDNMSSVGRKASPRGTIAIKVSSSSFTTTRCDQNRGKEQIFIRFFRRIRFTCELRINYLEWIEQLKIT